MKLLAKLKQKARELKAEARVLLLAYKDPRTPLSAKILIGITVGYLLSPIDLIPDFIPVLGVLDDFVIVPALIALSIKLIPQDVLQDAREIVRQDADGVQKKNWWFATVIITIWILSVVLLSRWALKYFGWYR